jgi:hypothetical protein
MKKAYLIIIYLNKNQKGIKIRCYFKHKASVLCEPFYVPFISCVDKDWSFLFGTTPIGIIYEISLLKSLIALRVIIEMIKYLCKEFCPIKSIIGTERELCCISGLTTEEGNLGTI